MLFRSVQSRSRHDRLHEKTDLPESCATGGLIIFMEETFALIERSHHGDKEAREQLVEENMGLVWSVVKRFTGRGTDMEDLFQIGAMGLLKAIDKFDTSFEVKFSTYAVPMIAGEIKRFLRDDGIVKVSRTLKENCWKIKRETELFRQKTGREPTDRKSVV